MAGFAGPARCFIVHRRMRPAQAAIAKREVFHDELDYSGGWFRRCLRSR